MEMVLGETVAVQLVPVVTRLPWLTVVVPVYAAFLRVVVPEPLCVKPPLPANGLEIVSVPPVTTKPLFAVKVLVVPERLPPANVKVAKVGL